MIFDEKTFEKLFMEGFDADDDKKNRQPLAVDDPTDAFLAGFEDSRP